LYWGIQTPARLDFRVYTGFLSAGEVSK
jgi:hypothetical protein